MLSSLCCLWYYKYFTKHPLWIQHYRCKILIHFKIVHIYFSEQVEPVPLDESTASTLNYIRGSVLRRILNHTSCSECTDTLIQNVKEKNSSKFNLLIDFTGISLLEPSELMFNFFHILFSVYLGMKPALKSLSRRESVLKILILNSKKVLLQKSFNIPFCPDHSTCYTEIMIQSTMKTFLKAFVHEMNEKSDDRFLTSTGAKNRKLNILSKKV